MAIPRLDESEDKDITLKIEGLPQYNELDYYAMKFEEAMKKFNSNPSDDNKKALELANKTYFEAQAAYKVAQRLMTQRAMAAIV